MQSQTLIIFIFFLGPGNINAEVPADLDSFLNATHQFFKAKQINVLTIFSCFNLDENVNINKKLSADHFQVQIITRPLDNWEYSGHLRTGVVADMDCNLVDFYTNKSREYLLFMNNFIWLFCDLDGTRNRTDLMDYFRNVDVLPISEVTVLNFKNKIWYDVYKVSSDRDPILTKISDDNRNNNKHSIRHALNSLGTVGSRRRNLQNIYLNAGIVTTTQDLDTTFDDISVKHFKTHAKSNVPLMQYLMQDLNFGLNLLQINKLGRQNKNGSFDGLVGHLSRGDIELGTVGIQLKSDRLSVITYAAEMFIVKTSLIFRQPPLSLVSNIFVLPFNTYVWIACIMLAVFIVVAFIFQWKLKCVQQQLHPLEAVTFVLGANFQQGFYLSLNSISGRIVVMITYISSIALFTSYAANLVALLQSPSHTIKTIPDLVSSQLKIVVQNELYNKFMYTETDDPDKVSLYKKKIEPFGSAAFVSVETGIKKMRTGSYAFQVERNDAYQVISDTFEEHEKCGLKELPAFMLPRLAIPMRKNSPYRELFSQRLLWQREAGIMSRESKKYYAQKYKCPGSGGEFITVGFRDCRSAFVALGIGMGLSVLILILELMVKYSQRPRIKEKFKTLVWS